MSGIRMIIRGSGARIVPASANFDVIKVGADATPDDDKKKAVIQKTKQPTK